MDIKSNKSMFRDEEIENYIVVPPDGGWGWVVVTAAFFCNLITDGITYTFGIFLVDLAKEFNVSVGRITLTGSLTTFFYYLVVTCFSYYTRVNPALQSIIGQNDGIFLGPFVSALLNRFGFRFVAILGSIIGTGGFILASFSTNYTLFMLGGGVLTGLGFGMVSIPTVIICGFYFEKWRALATGIATCGSGIGTLLTPPLATFMLDHLDWRWTYRILAGFVLITGLLAILYRPLQPIKAVQDEREIQVIQEADSIGSFYVESPKKCCSCTCRRHHNINYPTTAEVIPIETVVFEIPERSEDRSSFSYATFATGTVITTYPSQHTTQVWNNESRVVTTSPRPRCCVCCTKCCRAISCGRCCMTVARPMYRDDIFFAHSLMLLPQYKDSIANHRVRKQKMRQTQTNSRGIPKTRSTGYHMSVTRVTTHRELYGGRDKSCYCHIAVMRTLSTMLDFRLLKSPAFQVFSWSGMFIVFGYLIPYLYIKDRAVDGGIASSMAFWLLSAIGAANTVGRIISGLLPSVTNIKVIEYSYVCITIAGVTTLMSGLCMKLECQFIYACVYGIAGSCIATLRPIIVVELFGLEHLTNAFGLQLMFMAMSGFLGTMVAGIVYDNTKDFNAPFYMSGSCLIVAAILLSAVRRIRRLEKKYNWCKI